jgi:hypothetical protein
VVDCAGLENRKAERPREFESHPLRSIDSEALTQAWPKSIILWHNKAGDIQPCSPVSGHVTVIRAGTDWGSSCEFESFAARFPSCGLRAHNVLA